MRISLVAAGLAVALAPPAAAIVYHLKWLGAVTLVEGNATGSGIRIGDAISSTITLDDTTLSAPTLLALCCRSLKALMQNKIAVFI